MTDGNLLSVSAKDWSPNLIIFNLAIEFQRFFKESALNNKINNGQFVIKTKYLFPNSNLTPIELILTSSKYVENLHLKTFFRFEIVAKRQSNTRAWHRSRHHFKGLIKKTADLKPPSQKI